MPPTINLLNLQQKYGMSLMMKIAQNMVKEMKMIQTLMIHDFVIIQMHTFL